MKFPFILGTSGNTSKCYGDLGCLEISENWYGMTRPINVLPQEREEINTQFILKTRETINAVRLLFKTITSNHKQNILWKTIMN